MYTVHRADINACGVHYVNTRFTNYVSHLSLLFVDDSLLSIPQLRANGKQNIPVFTV